MLLKGLNTIIVISLLLVGINYSPLTVMANSTTTTKVSVAIYPARDIEYNGEKDSVGIKDITSGGAFEAKKLGIFPSVLIGQALYESQEGVNPLVGSHNNLYNLEGEYTGDPYTTYAGMESELPEEFKDGGGDYRSYPTQYLSVIDYIDYISTGEFKDIGVLDAKTPEEQLELIVKAGWHTDDKDYVNKVLKVIEQHDLARIDDY